MSGSNPSRSSRASSTAFDQELPAIASRTATGSPTSMARWVLVAIAVLLLSVSGAPGTAGAQEDTTSTTALEETTTAPPDPTTSTTAAPTTTAAATTTTRAPGVTTSTVPAVPAEREAQQPTPAEPVPAPAAAAGDDPDDPDVTTTLPAGPPPGFTERQFRTFVDVVSACGADPGVVCSRLYAWTDNRVLAESAQWLVDGPLRFLVVLVLAVVANRLVRRAIGSSASKLVDRQTTATSRSETKKANLRQSLRVETAASTLSSAATVVIYTFAFFAALWQLDIDLTPFFAGAGIAGVALGFGAQNIVRDLLAGFFVIIEDQYGIGDTIDVGRATGVVEGISLRSTRVRDVEGTLWHVPNGVISEVGNLSQEWARVILDIDVAYDADHHEAGRLIKEAADELWHDAEAGIELLEEPQLWGIQSLGESSVVIRLAIKCAPANQWAAGRELRSRIKDRFDAAGLEIPFPQQTMWLRSDPGPDERPETS